MSAVSSTSSATGATTTANTFGNLSSADFMKIMMTELQSQDPLQPTDSSKILEQLSSLRNIESQLSLQQQLQSLVAQNQISAAGALIGKMVVGLDTTNTTVAGVVTSVLVQNGVPVLQLDSGKSLNMSGVTQIAPVTGG